MKTAYFSHPDFLLHDTGVGHPERPERLRAIEKYLQETDLWHSLDHLPFEPATEDQLALGHTLPHISRVREIAQSGGGALDGDTVVSPQSFEVAKLAVGAAIAATDAVLENRADNAFCAVRPPGHHAESGRRKLAVWGFCLFNAVAIAAKWAQQKHGLERVAIVDFDVHHGNGTQEIFWEDESVLYVSLHEWGIFPNSGGAHDLGDEGGHGATLNLPLPANSNGTTYRRVWTQVGQKLREFKPQLLILSCGYDAHLADPLAHMALLAPDYANLILDAKNWAKELCENRLVCVLEGGYNLGALAESVAATLEVLGQD